MWRMAGNTIVAVTRAPAGVPVPGHAPVGAVLIVAVLGAMTLGTKLHRVGHFQKRAIGQPQLSAVLGVVAGIAGQRTMLERNSGMKRLSGPSRPGGLGVRSMASDTRDPNGRTVDIGAWGINHPKRRGPIHDHRIALGGRDLGTKRTIRVRKTLVTCQ